MSTNAIGTGALILSANADRMLAGLDKAGKQATDKAKDIGDKVNKAGGDGIGKFLGGVAFGVGMGIVMEKAGKAATAMIEMVNHAKEFRQEMQRAAAMTAEVAKVSDRMNKGFDERLGAIANPADRLAETVAQIKRAEAELAGQQAMTNAARRDIETLNSSVGKGATDSWKLWLGGGWNDSVAEATARLEAADAATSKFKDRLSELRESAARLKMPELDPKLVGSVNQLTESFKLQRETLGMTAEDAAIYGLKIQGASDAMLAGVRVQAELLKKARLDAAPAGPTQLGGAMQRGSTEAYSLVAKFQASNTVTASADKKREAQAREQIELLKKLVNAVSGAELLKVI